MTDATFAEEVLAHDGVVLVEFWAAWAGPCRQLQPVVEELARELSGSVKVVKVDTEESPEVAHRYRISSIPTLLVVRRGEVVATLLGSRSKAAIRETLAGIAAA
ncbi:MULTISPECIES: thioredoxin [Miniimonas]|uniref:thioredoxin n=1 Tax=Miniimonas TaxID=947525 RepID=UPI001EFFFECA|nr:MULTISPECIES: thioredoxin [Miniimonas]